jgi:hypothetical protein
VNIFFYSADFLGISEDFYSVLEFILFSLFYTTTSLSDFVRDMQANLLNQVGQKKVSVFVKCERFTK